MKILASAYILVMLLSCAAGENQTPAGFHYYLTKPEKVIVPDALEEISGITFGSGNETVYAIQDEDGFLFQFNPASKAITQTKFGKKGDYEDVSISNGTVYVLKSNGSIYVFPLSAAGTESVDNVAEYKLLPEGEYEGLFADDETDRLYVLCKHCKGQKHDGLSGYVIVAKENKELSLEGNFSLDLENLDNIAGDKKDKFHPSALTKNSRTKEWFILSSVNKMLVVTDSAWTGKQALPLDPGIFVQPEGIAFDHAQNLYISNEAGTTSNGNILKFSYRP